MNFPPGRPPNPIAQNQQLQLKREHAKAFRCECGSKFFIPCLELLQFSALTNPTGKRILVPEQNWKCAHCGEYYDRDLRHVKMGKAVKNIRKN